MLSRLLRTIADHGLISRGDRVLVGLSGGPDSTALLHALWAVRERLGIHVAAACVDHGLRPESAQEALSVASRCRTAEIECHVLRVDVRAARGKHVSWQDAARRARLAALETAAHRLGCNRIALGHTADDQAETILFRIVRGTGISGLAGIPYQRDSFVRPLLDVRRADILRFVAKRHLAVVQDPSNADPRFTRSRVRHAWLPLLRQENPKIVDALLALAADARAADSLPKTDLPAGVHLSRRAAETVARLTARAAGTQTIAVAGGAVEVSYGKTNWRGREGGEKTADPADARVTIGVPDGAAVYRLPGPSESSVAVEIRNQKQFDGRPGDKDIAAFDLDSLTQPLSLRTLRPGDRMRPRGGRGSRKISDLLIDAKIPRPQRAFLPALVTGADEIIFVPGLRPSERGRPSPETKRWLGVRVRQIGT